MTIFMILYPRSKKGCRRVPDRSVSESVQGRNDWTGSFASDRTGSTGITADVVKAAEC